MSVGNVKDAILDGELSSILPPMSIFSRILLQFWTGSYVGYSVSKAPIRAARRVFSGVKVCPKGASKRAREEIQDRNLPR